MKTLLSILFALTFTVNLAGQGFDQEILVDAELNDLVSLSVPQECSESRWLGGDLLSTHHQVDATSGTLYLVARKSCEVLLVMVCDEGDQRLVIYRYSIKVGKSDDDDPAPTPTPVDEKFDGDDSYGLGKLSWEVSRPINQEARAKFASILTIAAKRLQGVGGILFVNRDLFEYLSNNSDEWTKPILEELESRKTDPLKLIDWINMLEEIKKGVTHE